MLLEAAQGNKVTFKFKNHQNYGAKIEKSAFKLDASLASSVFTAIHKYIYPSLLNGPKKLNSPLKKA